MLRKFYLSFTLLSIFNNALLDLLAAPDIDTILRNMIKAMNRSVDPCDNFYEYMCGNWLAHNPIPPDEESWSELAKLRRTTKHRLRAILEERYQTSDTEQIQLAKMYYQSCMNEEAIEANGLQPITEILERNGGWPIVAENWTTPSVNDTWQTLHATYQRFYDVGAFFKISLNADYDNSSRIVIVINRNTAYPLLNSMTAEQVTDFFLVYTSVIKDTIVDIIEDSGKNATTEVLDEIAELILFQSLLQQAQQIDDVGSSNGKNYEGMSIKALQYYYDNGQPFNPASHIDFLGQIRTIFEELGDKINEDTVVEVHNKQDLLSLKGFLDTASPRMSVNYVHWNLVANFLPYTNRKMRGYLHKLRSVFLNSIQETPRWETCVDEMQLEQALSYSFVQKYSNDAVIGKVTNMAFKIRQEIHKRILQSPNLSNLGKDYVSRKLNSLNFVIGYPRWYSNESAVTQYYDGLIVGPDYFQNRLNYHLYERKKYVLTFGQPFDKYSWFKSSATVNAYYYPQANTVVVPLAKFLDTLPGTSLPEVMSYALVGSVLGHEMTHSITGEIDLLYDENGNRLSTPVNTTTHEGDMSSDCFVKKFGKYILVEEGNETIYLNGFITRLENMADTLGIQVARDAYLSAKGEINEPLFQLPQELASFTEEQLFFMLYASQSCYATWPELRSLTVNMDVHSPPRYRVDGTLSNSDAFSRTFNCLASSPMASADKCQTL